MPFSHKLIPDDWHMARKYSMGLLSKQNFKLVQKRSPRPPSIGNESSSMHATQLFEKRKAMPSSSSGCIKGPAVDVLDEELDDDEDDEDDDEEEELGPSDSAEGSTLQVRAQSKTSSCSAIDGKGALVV